MQDCQSEADRSTLLLLCSLAHPKSTAVSRIRALYLLRRPTRGRFFFVSPLKPLHLLSGFSDSRLIYVAQYARESRVATPLRSVSEPFDALRQEYTAHVGANHLSTFPIRFFIQRF